MRQLARLCSAAVICLSAAGCGRDQPVTRGLLRTVDTPTPSAKLLQQERTRTCIEAAEAEAAPQARRDTAAGRAYPSALASQPWLRRGGNSKTPSRGKDAAAIFHCACETRR